MRLSRLLCLSVCLGVAVGLNPAGGVTRRHAGHRPAAQRRTTSAPVASGARPGAHRPGAHQPTAHAPAVKRSASLPISSAPFTARSPTINPATFKWDSGRQGAFIMCMCGDLRGRLFVGTEDHGVWLYDASQPAAKAWTQFTTKDGFGDDSAYSLVCDRLGRVWAGSSNHGVSVFNGATWKNYDIMTGPQGSHVVALAVNPVNGDVWGATEAGLFRYREKQKEWLYTTRADGLPSDQASCLAFSKTGTLFVGLQCDGLAIADANADHPKWRNVRGIDTLPSLPDGADLPSSLINCIHVSADNTVFVGTTTGLAWSKDGGASFQHMRGKDWADKIRGLVPSCQPPNIPGTVLSEDYINCLAATPDRGVFVGHRQKGLEIYADAATRPAKQPNDDDITVLIPANRALLEGTYGAGVKLLSENAVPTPRRALLTKAATPDFPLQAGLFAYADLNFMGHRLSRTRLLRALSPAIIPLEDDWLTRGDWIDRYGRLSAVLCAMNGGGCDDVAGYRQPLFSYRTWLGPEAMPGDCVRYWVHWQHTDNPASLQYLTMGGRKQSEHDCHGETYPQTLEAPSVYETIKLPKGQYIVSLYFFNKDGDQLGPNRFRDFLVECCPSIISPQTFAVLGMPDRTLHLPYAQVMGPGGARSRVRDFHGGVYKRFYVNAGAGGVFTFRVNRNYSFNTLVSGVFVDPVGELPGMLGPVTQPPKLRVARESLLAFAQEQTAEKKALWIVDRLLVLRDTNPSWYYTKGRTFLVPLMRALLTKDATGDCLAKRIEKSLEIGPGFRGDVTECLAGIQQFAVGERIYYRPDHYSSWQWLRNTDLGRKNNWDYAKYRLLNPWDSTKYQAFIKECQDRQSW